MLCAVNAIQGIGLAHDWHMKAHTNPAGGGVGEVWDSHTKRSEMFVVKFELNLYFTPERYHLKRNTPDYQSLFRKGARVRRPDARDQWKSSLETEITAFLLSSFQVRHNRYCDT